MNKKVEFSNVKWINDSMFQGLVKARKKFVEEDLAAEIRTGGYTAYGVLHSMTLEYKRIARRKRIAKQVAKQQRAADQATNARTIE